MSTTDNNEETVMTPFPVIEPRYPDIHMEAREVSGGDGWLHSILRVSGAMKRAGIPKAEIKQFRREATESGDTWGTIIRWVHVIASTSTVATPAEAPAAARPKTNQRRTKNVGV